MSIIAFLKGFGVGFGLIAAIGAQNAYVLTRGICRNHHWAVALIGSLIDALLIAAGIFGMGKLIQQFPHLLTAIAIGGASFLFIYGGLSFKRMFAPGHLRSHDNKVSLKTAILAMLALSFLNPHVYLDTVVLLGSVAVQEIPSNRIIFAAGAITASCVWFFSLALTGQWLQPWFKKPATWCLLDFIIGVIMWAIALTLVMRLI